MPVPLKFIITVQPLKGREELIRVGHVEARTVVADEIDDNITSQFRIPGSPDFDVPLLLMARKLPRIANQVLQGQLQKLLVPTRSDPLLQDELHIPVGLALLKVLGDLQCKLVEVDVSAFQLEPAWRFRTTAAKTSL